MSIPTTTANDAVARACMASLIGSLADNKAALGRRYAEWAVSAPTLESAVAAAAMAQDELGHARATYPILKALGADECLDGGGNRLERIHDAGDLRLHHCLFGGNAYLPAEIYAHGIVETVKSGE